MIDDATGFATWFRHAAPYIRAHRGRTFVIVFAGEAMRSRHLPELVQDVALLHSLGIRLVLVAGSRPQIERRLKERGQAAHLEGGVRITDAAALRAAKEAAGENRVELERLLSMALPGSPMAGARVRVSSGNYVVAKPLGVIDGVDFQSTGRVRRIDVEGIQQRLDDGAIVILTPLGYSLTGDAFNLTTPELAAHAAAALGADKLVGLVEGKGLKENELTADAAAKKKCRGELALYVDAAVHAVRGGVPRAHLIPRKEDGGLLRELFTKRGIGCLVTQTPSERVRPARPHDVPALMALLEPLERSGFLVHRPREVLERDINEFVVAARDEEVLGCAALHRFGDDGELACLAVDGEHRASGRGRVLLKAVVDRAKELGLKRLFVLTTQSSHFFVEQGFVPSKPSELPKLRKRYDHKRKSKVLVLPLA